MTMIRRSGMRKGKNCLRSGVARRCYARFSVKRLSAELEELVSDFLPEALSLWVAVTDQDEPVDLCCLPVNIWMRCLSIRTCVVRVSVDC